ncbi:hypothetical protein [Sphingobium mellinum]|uniref:hypothetical protein n=1 Tax=Sphingobium mellinum TaxID=1387166 RepID=UPI0030EF2B79
MTIAHPRIGMDRYVDADWMELAAGVVRGEMLVDGLHARLANDIPGAEVRKKTIGILNRMWFPAADGSSDLITQAARGAAAGGTARTAAFEAVAISAYPYFRQVVENVGRLFRLQGSCTAGEVHRRMFEQHGKRTTVDQATSYGFKTMISWGMIVRQEDRRLGPAHAGRLEDDCKRLLDIAANRSRSSVTPLAATDPLLFPFC